MIEAHELTKRYGDTTAVHSLSFAGAARHRCRGRTPSVAYGRATGMDSSVIAAASR